MGFLLSRTEYKSNMQFKIASEKGPWIGDGNEFHQPPFVLRVVDNQIIGG